MASRLRAERPSAIEPGLYSAGDKLTSTISSPIQVHGVSKVDAKRAPELGEHSEEILRELNFDAKQIEQFFASRIVSGRREEPVLGGVR